MAGRSMPTTSCWSGAGHEHAPATVARPERPGALRPLPGPVGLRLQPRPLARPGAERADRRRPAADHLIPPRPGAARRQVVGELAVRGDRLRLARPAAL